MWHNKFRWETERAVQTDLIMANSRLFHV